MKKLPLIVGAVVVVGATGGGAYAVLSHKTAPAPVAATTVKQKHLNLSTLLAALQAKYPTIQETYIYSASQDPNGNLGKAGYYTSGAEFYDTRTNTPPSSTEEADSTAFGCDAGGAIEVYATASDAAKRIAYLQQFQGSPALDPGAFKQIDNVVMRASSQYSAADQTDVVSYLASEVQAQLK